jgi:hypothetical protein
MEVIGTSGIGLNQSGGGKHTKRKAAQGVKQFPFAHFEIKELR